MPTQVQFRRGTTTQNNNFTGAAGELSIDTTVKTLRIHDGSTSGGSELALANLSNTSAITGSSTTTLSNKTFNLSSNTLLGTIAQFNTALSDADFATLAGVETLTNKTINGDNNTISNIANGSLKNSSITINGSSVSLGGTRTLVADDVSESGTPTNKYFTDARARAAISVTDSGGDGSLSYNSGTGIITYNGPSANEVRAHFSAGTGVTLSSGQISIGQAVSTGSNVTFNDLTLSGNLTVNGTTTTVNSNTVTIGDSVIVLNSDETGTPSQDAGIEVERGTATNASLLWVEADDVWAAGLTGSEVPLVTTTGTQTLTNKTLTSPVISSIVNTGTLTLPTSTDTLVGRATTDTLTNKTLTSPTLTTPVLGTPSSGTLTNCTGLPISTGVSGLGTGVATALAVNTGTDGAFVVKGGALGTPSSGTLTNCTGLPVTGISGLGTGVATFLATPSSANLVAAMTDETGSGALYFTDRKSTRLNSSHVSESRMPSSA